MARLVDAARQIIRQGGIDALSMRAIADELGVSGMAAYNHVVNKDELIGLVAESVHREWPKLELGDERWEVVLRRHLIAMCSSYRRYPGLGAYVSTHTDFAEGRASATDAVRFLEAAGFSHDRAVLGWGLAHTYIIGRMNVEHRLRQGGHRRQKGEHTEEEYVTFAVDAIIAGLSAVAGG